MYIIHGIVELVHSNMCWWW